MAVATLARKPGAAKFIREKDVKCHGRSGRVQDGAGERRWLSRLSQLHTTLDEEMSLGDPDLQQKSTPEPGWNGR